MVRLPDIYIPSLDGVPLWSVHKARDEFYDEVASFRKAYHKLLTEALQANASSNLAAATRQISDEILDPALRKLDKKYRRAVEKQRWLSMAGATVGGVSISCTLISAHSLQQVLVDPQTSGALLVGAANMLTSIMLNAINKRDAVKALDEQEFYILWKVRSERKSTH